MSSLDKTMHFDFNQNKGKNVYDTVQDVYNALEERATAQLIKLLVTYSQATLHIFLGIMMPVI